MQKRIFITLLFSALLLACQKSGLQHIENTQSDSILNGKAADMASFQARAVVLIYDYANSYLCTGTLIDQNIVLTAAHCALGDKTNYKILFEVQNSRANYERKVTAIVTHEKYNRKELDGTFDMTQERADIALIKFSGNLPPGYAPVLLPQKFDSLPIGQEFMAFGFGRTGYNSSSANELMSKNLRINLNQAKKNEFMVDQRSSGGICPGDSGGPAMIERNQNLYVIGVASAIIYPEKTARNVDLCQFDSIYTSVAFYRDWLDQKISILKSN